MGRGGGEEKKRPYNILGSGFDGWVSVVMFAFRAEEGGKREEGGGIGEGRRRRYVDIAEGFETFIYEMDECL